MLMQKLRTVALAALVVAASAAALVTTAVPTSAAPLAPVPAAPAGDDTPATLADLNARLLLNRKVLRELKCDIDQLDKIMDAVEAAEKKSQEVVNGLLGAIGPNVDPMVQEKLFRDAQERADRTFSKAAGDVAKEHLTAAQRKRLAQIDLQSRGYAALSTPAVVKLLKITDDKKVKLAESAEKVQKELEEALNGLGNGAAVFNIDAEMAAVRKVQEGANKRAMALLTDEQRKAWKDMTGAPVKFELPFNDDPYAFGFGGAFAVPAIPVPPPPVVQPDKPNG